MQKRWIGTIKQAFGTGTYQVIIEQKGDRFLVKGCNLPFNLNGDVDSLELAKKTARECVNGFVQGNFKWTYQEVAVASS